jgi:hypothetical protein
MGFVRDWWVEKDGNGTKTASSDWGKPMRKPAFTRYRTPPYSVVRSGKRSTYRTSAPL